MPPSVDYGQATNLVNDQTKAFQDLLNSQKGEQQGYFDKYSTLSSSQPKLVNTLNTAQQAAGIGGLQGSINLFNTQATGVKGLIDKLNEDTAARTTGTGATQAYLDRMRAVEGGGLNTQLSRLTTGLGDATNAYNTANANTGQLLSATQADQATALKPLELQISSLGDRFAREITGFTTSKQNELSTLLTKLQNDQTLKLDEWKRANDLADAEANFQRQRQLQAEKAAQDQANARASLGNPIPLGGGGGGGTTTAPAAKQPVGAMTTKQNGGGFAFTSANGQPVSAATFAANNGVSIADLLYKMGSSGDSYAAQAYNQIKANQGIYAANPNILKSEFAPLFWGT